MEGRLFREIDGRLRWGEATGWDLVCRRQMGYRLPRPYGMVEEQVNYMERPARA
jgi:hypothetical protein